MDMDGLMDGWMGVLAASVVNIAIDRRNDRQIEQLTKDQQTDRQAHRQKRQTDGYEGRDRTTEEEQKGRQTNRLERQ